MQIALFGYGKMGKAVEQLAKAQGDEILLIVLKNSFFNQEAMQKCDICIDFSHPQAVLSHVGLACQYKKPIVIGTTGWEIEMGLAKNMVEKSQNGALYAPNFSLGVHYFIHLLKFAQKLYNNYALRGVETHHAQKKDAPSGTAKAIANTLNMGADFTSIRDGTTCGKHEVFFDSSFDTICLTHEAKNREAFAQGALIAAKWLKDKIGWYTLDDLTRSLYSISHTL